MVDAPELELKAVVSHSPWPNSSCLEEQQAFLNTESSFQSLILV